MTDRVVIPLADGRWLALDRATFNAALAAGREFSAAPSPAAAATDEPLLDAEQAAQRLGVTARWLEDSARLGIIPCHKLGRFIRFRVSDVAAHCRIEGAPMPTDCESVSPFRRQQRQ